MALKYSKAPISEVVCGMYFNTNLLLQKGSIFDLLHNLIQNYPSINTHPVLFPEELINDTIQTLADYSKTGFVTYHLVSEDKKWHVFLHQNAITLHWNREDLEPTGNYPGFELVFKRFFDIYCDVMKLLSSYDIAFRAEDLSFYLAYSDRINLEGYKEKGLSISNIINITPPSFCINNKEYKSTNYFNKYSLKCDEINGYSIIGINSPTLPGIGQLLIVENRLRGNLLDIKPWFDKAHEIQLSFFETIFSNEILNNWQ